jgi:hypothetical protein
MALRAAPTNAGNFAAKSGAVLFEMGQEQKSDAIPLRGDRVAFFRLSGRLSHL